jgi:ABC-type nitrate/sulfonate/bicarbonate transport system substrate-binding protein
MYRLLLILVAIAVPAIAAAQTKVKVGTVRATVIGGVVSAQARGYFKEAGIDVDINLIDASAGFVPLLANNELNVVEGSAPIYSTAQRRDCRSRLRSIRRRRPSITASCSAPI